MNEEPDRGLAALKLLREKAQGVLGTISLDGEGFPFGSAVTYSLDPIGRPGILIGKVTQHFKNISADPRVSLTVLGGPGRDVRSEARLSYLAKAQELSEAEDDVKERYFSYFPETRIYGENEDFVFYRLVPFKLHYMGGFNRISWVQEEEILEPNPFFGKPEQQIIEEMNTRHQPILSIFCAYFTGQKPESPEEVQMIGMDGAGFHLRFEGSIFRVNFKEFVTSSDEARDAFLAMAKEIKTRRHPVL